MGLKIKSSHLPDEILEIFMLLLESVSSYFGVHYNKTLQFAAVSISKYVQFFYFMVVKFGMCVHVCMHV